MLKQVVAILFCFVLSSSGFALAQEDPRTIESSDIESCVCGPRIPWGWASCPGNPKAPCDTCYGPDGIIAYVPWTNKTFKLESGCENLQGPDVMLVATNPEELQKMQAAVGNCFQESARDPNRYVCQNVSNSYFQLGDNKTTLVGVTEITLAEAKKMLDGKANQKVIWWDSFFNNQFRAIRAKWSQLSGTASYASGTYVVCKKGSNQYSVNSTNLYGADEIKSRAEEVLRTLPSGALVFPPGSKICALELNADFVFSFGASSRQAERHVFEINGKLYGYRGNYYSN